MPSNQYEARRQITKMKLTEALGRLMNRPPSNPKLEKKLQQGGYQLSISALAPEAGISRNAINTNHKEIIEDLRTIQRHSKNMPQTLKTPNDKIPGLRGLLRTESAKHEHEKRLLVTENASLVVRIRQTEKRLAETRRKLDQLQRKIRNGEG